MKHNQDVGGPERRRPHRGRQLVEVAVVVAVLSVLVSVRLPTLDEPLLEAHGFRQTQTAYGALVFHEDGVDWLRPRLPVLGPDAEIPLEFPLFQAMASVPMAHGVSADASMRLTGLACFVATALSLWALLRRIEGPMVAITGLIIFGIAPFSLVWSRTSMIEYLATAGSIAYVLGGLECRRRFRWPIFLAAVGAGSVAFLVKPTTAVVYLVPLIVGCTGRTSETESAIPRWLLTLVGVPLALGALWTLHADAVKRSNPFGEYLTSAALREWNVGTLAQRVGIRDWSQLLHIAILAGGSALAIGLGLVALARSLHVRFWLGWLGAALVAPLLWFNLYVVHDYYMAAISPILASVAALGIMLVVTVVGELRPTLGPPLLGAALVGALALWSADAYRGTGFYWREAFDPVPSDDPVLTLAAELRAFSQPEELVVIEGMDYSPEVLYYARRKGTALPLPGPSWPGELTQSFLVGALRGHAVLVAPAPVGAGLQTLHSSAWFTPVSPHIYRLASDSASLLRSHPVAATMSSTETGDMERLNHLSYEGRLICGSEPTSVPPASTVIFDSEVGGPVWISVGEGLAPIPQPAALVTSTRPTPTLIGCSGGSGVGLRILAAGPG